MMKLGISLALESDIGANLSGWCIGSYATAPGRADWTIRPVGAVNGNPALESFLKLLSSRYPSTCLGR
jgi:hypothetical protein